MTQRPVNCRYFHGDYFRGKNSESCRLIEATPTSPRPWRRKLCDSCPVPEIVITSNSRDLLLEGEVRRKFLRDQVEVTFAICGKHMLQLVDPRHCPACAAEETDGNR